MAQAISDLSAMPRRGYDALQPIMRAPKEDLEARKPIWNRMQMFWMDTDPSIFLSGTAEVCAASRYTLEDLRSIFWNEVYPAVSFNMLCLPAPEWCGFDVDWLAERVLKTNRFGKRLPLQWLHPYSRMWWRCLEAGIIDLRKKSQPSHNR